MRIERINDNQIRCTLTSTDLSTRNLNLGELAYGSEKARSLFREMIQKASTEVGFDAEDDIPLMVEAIPLSSESVMLVITKIEDPEELDTRFSKFSQLSEEDPESSTRFAGEFLEGADDLMEYLNKELQAIFTRTYGEPKRKLVFPASRRHRILIRILLILLRVRRKTLYRQFRKPCLFRPASIVSTALIRSPKPPE